MGWLVDWLTDHGDCVEGEGGGGREVGLDRAVEVGGEVPPGGAAYRGRGEGLKGGRGG